MRGRPFPGGAAAAAVLLVAAVALAAQALGTPPSRDTPEPRRHTTATG